jgi:hypothetical protein
MRLYFTSELLACGSSEFFSSRKTIWRKSLRVVSKLRNSWSYDSIMAVRVDKPELSFFSDRFSEQIALALRILHYLNYSVSNKSNFNLNITSKINF